MLWTLRYSSARADNGAGLELAVVAAVLLGGVSIFGGKGTLPGVLAGVVLLAALQNALRLADVSDRGAERRHRRPADRLRPRSQPRHLPSAAPRVQRRRPPQAIPGRSSKVIPCLASPAGWRCRSSTAGRPGRSRWPPAAVRTTSDSADDSAGGTGAPAGAAADPNAPLKEGLKIAFLPKQLNNPYTDVEVGGGKAAVGEFKGEYKLVGPNDASASSQVSYINTLIQQQQDVIVIAANDPNAVCPSLNQARKAGDQGRLVRLGRRQGLPRRLHQPGHHRRASARAW